MFKHIGTAIIRFILACCVLCDGLRFIVRRMKRDV